MSFLAFVWLELASGFPSVILVSPRVDLFEFGFPQSYLLQSSFLTTYHFSTLNIWKKHLPVLYPCTVCCSRFPGFCPLQRHIKKDNNNTKNTRKNCSPEVLNISNFIRTFLNLPGVDQSPKSIVFSQFWYGIFLPWCWSVTEEPCSYECFRAKTSANPQQNDFSCKTRTLYIFVLKLTIKL